MGVKTGFDLGVMMKSVRVERGSVGDDNDGEFCGTSLRPQRRC